MEKIKMLNHNKKQPSILKNYIYNIIYEVLILILPFITATYTSRIFEPDGIGIYSYSNTIASYALLLGSLGINVYGQREIARLRDDINSVSVTFWELFILKSFTMLISLTLYIFLVFFSGKYSIYLQALSILIIAGIFDISWFYRGIENFKWVTLWQIIVKIVSIICLFTFIKEKSDLVLYIILLSLSTLLGNLSMWLKIKKNTTLISYKKLKPMKHLKNTFVYFIPSIATSVYTQLDKLMIGWITKDDFENGYYEQAIKMVTMCKTLVLSINTVMSSRMSYLFENKKYEEIKERISTTINYILVLSVPITIGICSIASDFVPVFFGEGYDKVIILLYILSPIIFVVGISNALGACYFTPSGQRARSNKVIILGAFVNALLNLFLICPLKSIGASIASIIAEAVIAIIYLYMGKEYISLKNLAIMIWKKIFASMVMLVVIIIIKYFTETTVVSLFIEIVAGASVYFIILLILKDKIIMNMLIFLITKFK